MFNKILIANRGEIALRVIRACKELDIPVVAIYSTVDRDSIHVKLADESVCVGPAHVSESYLNIPHIISAAILSGCDALHPGYGFLAESAEFAEICESHDLTFIGPSAPVIRLMGDKVKAKEAMKKAKIPVLDGTGIIKKEDEAVYFARESGYPILIKAVAGGGGKGIRVVKNEEELKRGIEHAASEAKASFGDGRLYLEKYIQDARHIEFQILADRYGNVVHLGERDCSVQRRNQKLVEESPSQAVSRALRNRMGESAVRGCQAVGYNSVGTVEFLLDRETGDFYFMEMNTRIQVEHPVTEMVTGIDLVKEQIKIAAGNKIGYKQDEIQIRGHAIECRINAEDPGNNFSPCLGVVNGLHIPGGNGIRVDTHIYDGCEISPYYDSLLGKIITWGENRDEAIKRMKRSLDEFWVGGIKTNVPFHKKIINNAFFLQGEIHTRFVETQLFLELKLSS